MGFLEKLFGTYSEREVKKLQIIADKIEALDESMQKLTDEELKAKTIEFKDRIQKVRPSQIRNKNQYPNQCS